MRVAARSVGFHIVEFQGEAGGVSSKETLAQIQSVFESKQSFFDHEMPPLLFFVCFSGAFESRTILTLVSLGLNAEKLHIIY